MNSSSIQSNQLSQFFRSLAYAYEVSFLDTDTSQKLFKRLGQLVESNLITDNNFDSLNHSFSKGQVDSKIWLINTINSLNLNLGLVYLCAGWYATLLLCPRFQFDKIRNIDIDQNSLNIANFFHKHHIIDGWKYLSVNKNIMDVNFNQHAYTALGDGNVEIKITESPDTIINTSCEHIKNFSTWYNQLPVDKLLILQSNNGFNIEDHINAVADLKEFENQTPMSRVLYSSELNLQKFTRFMRIGYK